MLAQSCRYRIKGVRQGQLEQQEQDQVWQQEQAGQHQAQLPELLGQGSKEKRVRSRGESSNQCQETLL